MTEQFLHYLWQYSLLPLHKMRLSSGCEFVIQHAGLYNKFESGPDFTNARIKIDQLLWCGAVEIHIKASDWYAHGHQNDRAYDNVVLHVVYENDLEIIQNGIVIPALVLKNCIPDMLFENYLRLLSGKSNILCKSFLKNVDSIFIKDMLTRASIERLERKVFEIEQQKDIDEQQVFYMLLARAFGSKVNALAFEELVQRMPYRAFRALNPSLRQLALKRVSGLDDLNSPLPSFPLALERMNPSSWKFKGLHPSSFPDRRIIQFANFLNFVSIDNVMNIDKCDDLKGFVSNLVSNYNDAQVSSQNKLSTNFQNNLLINCFLPFMIWNLRKSNYEFDMESAVELLSLLKPEANHIVSEWKLTNVIAENAFESQGMIELYGQYCTKKRCLQCTIGSKVMRE